MSVEQEDEPVAPLIEAIWRDDIDRVRSLLQSGADPNAVDCDTPALLWAVMHRNPNLVQVLLEGGADVHRGDIKALSRAAFLGDETIVDMLFSAGADPRMADADGSTALMSAAKSGRAAIAIKLLKAGAVVDSRDAAGRTALYWASVRGHFSETVYSLLAAEADPNAQSDTGTPLTGSAFIGARRTIDVLLAAGADVNLPEQQSGVTPLMAASAAGHADVVVTLLDKRADVNRRSPDGATALMYAARDGHRDVVRQLLVHGADVHLGNVAGHTAVSVARANGHLEIVQDLVAAGATLL